MSFVREKKVNGSSYRYLVETERVNGRVVQKHLKYLGKP
jgi:hypothetical protein